MHLKKIISLFTLSELLIVSAIFITLISLLTPSLSSMLKRSYAIKCAQQISKTGAAFGLYADDYFGLMPDHFNEYTGQVQTSGPTIMWHLRQGVVPEPGIPLGPGLLVPDYVELGRIFYCPDHEFLTPSRNTPTKKYDYIMRYETNGVSGINGAARGYAHYQKPGEKLITTTYYTPSVRHSTTSSWWLPATLDEKLEDNVSDDNPLLYDLAYRWHNGYYYKSHDLKVTNILYGDGAVLQMRNTEEIFWKYGSGGLSSKAAFPYLKKP